MRTKGTRSLRFAVGIWRRIPAEIAPFVRSTRELAIGKLIFRLPGYKGGCGVLWVSCSEFQNTSLRDRGNPWEFPSMQEAVSLPLAAADLALWRHPFRPIHFASHSYMFRLTFLLTYSMKQSPSWEANGFSASQEIPHILWNPKFHYCIHKSPPPLPTFSQLVPVHTSTSHFLKIHFNIILPSPPGFSKWFLTLRFPHLSPISAACPAHPIFSILSPKQYLVSTADH